MKSRGFKGLCAALCCALALFLPVAGLAASAVNLECNIGYNGSVTYLRRLPITVEVENGGADASGVLAVDINRGDGVYDRYEMPVTVASGAKVRAVIPVMLTAKQSAYSVKWLEGGAVLAQREIKPSSVVDPTFVIVGALSDNPQSLSYLNITKTGDPLKRNEYWHTLPLTLETFPSDAESLRFFDILAVDGMDLSLLSQPQQNALDAWLRDGGIVLLGGGSQAGAAFPYFSKYSGITPGAPEDGGDVSGELLTLFKLSETPLGQSVMAVSLDGAGGQKAGSAPLVDVARVDDGYLFTASFSLSDKPFSAWQGKHVLWQRMLLSYAQARYKDIISTRSSNSYDTGGQYIEGGVTSQIGVDNSGGVFLPIALLMAFVLLVGFGSYFILKKLDKREWMWATVPALAAVCSLLMWALSGVIGLREPIAVSYTIVGIDKDGATDSFTGVAAAKADSGRMVVGAQQGSVDMNTSFGYYYTSYDGSEKAEPTTLRYSCSYGERESVSFPEKSSWEQNYFALRDVPLADCKVSGQCSWNGGNLEFTLQNSGSVAFEAGVIITDYGFVSVPALLPGQTHTAVMKPSTSKTGELADGVLLDEKTRMNFSYYDFIQAYTKVDDSMTAEQRDAIYLKRNMMNSRGNTADWNASGNCFHYLAFADRLADLNLFIDGKPVTRTAQRDMVDVTLSFNPISADGTVRFLKGSFDAYTAELDSTGAPQVTGEIKNNRYSYYQLNTDPVFAFDVSAIPDRWTLTSFDISPNYAYYPYTVSLYNFKTGSWDEFKVYDIVRSTGVGTAKIKLPTLSDCVDSSGMLYAQFRKNSNADSYPEIGTPVLTMDGRLK